MVLVRAVRLDDIDQLWELIQKSTYGLTTLQISKEQLSERIEHSDFAFHRRTEKASGEPYVLVMEDTASKLLIGLSCVFSKTGGYEPFYCYQRVKETLSCDLLGQTKVVESLQLRKIHNGPTELGSLFLDPEYRGQGRGRLMSLSRFTLMAAYPKRFAAEVIAEMRGVSQNGVVPFWEGIGRHFFSIDFPQADSLSTVDKRFIEDLMPRYPIYVDLLPESVRNVMGEVHENTRPALKMLLDEGFRKTEMIDIFDGGPVVACPRIEIGAVKRTERARLASIVAAPEGVVRIVGSLQGGFSAVLDCVKLTSDGLSLRQTTAELLGVSIGDEVFLTDPHPPS